MAQESYDPVLTRPEISNRLVRGKLGSFCAELGESVVSASAEEAGLPVSYLADPEGWVSIEFMNRWQAAMVERLYGLVDMVPYDHPFCQHFRVAGQKSMRREVMGAPWVLIRGMGSPESFIRVLPWAARKGNKVMAWEVLEHRPGRTVLRVRYTRDCGQEWPTACWNRIGFLEAIPTIWGLPRARVTQRECMHGADPASHCTYVVEYRPAARRELFLAVARAGLLGLGGGLASWVAGLWVPVGVLLGALLGLAIEGWRRVARGQRSHRTDVRELEALLDRSIISHQQLWAEGEELRRALLENKKIASYVSPDLLRLLQRQPALPRLGGRHVEVTVLFTDLASYSSLSESLDPSEVMRFLNEYFEEMSAVVREHGGTVLELMGDGMLVVFGAPQHLPDHAEQALRCALAMEGRLGVLNLSWETAGLAQLWRTRGMESIRARYGIQSGRVVAGNIGSAEQMKYTVIGDIVNQAARLEALNKRLGTRILLAEETHAQLSAELKRRTQDRGEHFVKGRKRPVRVHTVVEQAR